MEKREEHVTDWSRTQSRSGSCRIRKKFAILSARQKGDGLE